MLEFLNDVDSYEDRKVAKDISKSGIQVSTVLSSDEGYETALLTLTDIIPVERYEDKEAAEIGHKKWLEFSHSAKGKEVTMLGGFGGLVADKTIALS